MRTGDEAKDYNQFVPIDSYPPIHTLSISCITTSPAREVERDDKWETKSAHLAVGGYGVHFYVSRFIAK